MTRFIMLALSLGGGFEVGGDTQAAAPAQAQAQAQVDSSVVWRTRDVVEKSGDKTFVATGTRAGETYLFRARGVCRWQSISMLTNWGIVNRPRIGRIFGIDFRVTFGGGDKKFMNVGDSRPERTEVKFIADGDDVSIRVWDHWQLPDKVSCTVDDIEVVRAPSEE